MIGIIFIIALITILIFIFFLAMKKESVKLVFINEKTRKYHQKKCPYSKNLDSINLNEAIEEGYTPCKICNKI